MLHFKSSLVEEAVNELINMLLDVDIQSKEDNEKVVTKNYLDSETGTSGKRYGNEGVFLQDVYR